MMSEATSLKRHVATGVAAVFFAGIPVLILVLGLIGHQFATPLFLGWASIPLLIGLAYMSSGYYWFGGAITGGVGVAIVVAVTSSAVLSLLVVTLFIPFMALGLRLDKRVRQKIEEVPELFEQTSRQLLTAVIGITGFAIAYWGVMAYSPLNLDDSTKFTGFVVLLAAILAIVFRRKKTQ